MCNEARSTRQYNKELESPKAGYSEPSYNALRQLEEQKEFYLRKMMDIQIAIDALKRV